MAANGILSPGADDAQAQLTGEFVYFYLLLGPTICPDKKLPVPEKPSEHTFERLRQTTTKHYNYTKPKRVIIAGGSDSTKETRVITYW